MENNVSDSLGLLPPLLKKRTIFKDVEKYMKTQVYQSGLKMGMVTLKKQ